MSGFKTSHTFAPRDRGACRTTVGAAKLDSPCGWIANCGSICESRCLFGFCLHRPYSVLVGAGVFGALRGK